MKVASFVKATALLSAAAFVVSVGVADAQVTKDDAKCRATVQKNTGKLNATASKAIVGCWKSVLGGKIGFTDCNDSATADTKGKIAKAASKLTGAVGGPKTKCDDTTHAAALAEYQDCPSPGTAGTGMTTFAQVGVCLATIGQKMADNMHIVAMNPGATEVAAILASANAKAITKCAGGLQKAFNKVLATVGKTEGGNQAKVLDKAGGAYDYGSSGADPKGKVAGTVTKLNDGIAKSCSALSQADFALLRTCGDLTTVGACLEEIAKNGSSGVTAVSFEMPGVCPAEVLVTAKPRQSNGDTSQPTELDAGWTGFGHNAEIITFNGHVNLSCTDGTCSDCAVTVNCSSGNCRCDNDQSILCDEPFGPDADDCGGNDCNVYFGSPLPLSASGTPTCIQTRIVQELDGTADVGTGVSNTQVVNSSKVHTGINQTQPCPICSGGLCDSGARSGLACVDGGVSPTFGATSFDCPPDPLANVSGSGLYIELNFSDAPPPLDANVPCSLVGILDCHCQQCSGDTTIPCNSDAECAAAAAGTCTANTGAGNLPSNCNNACVVDGDGQGKCDGAGPTQSFCDGFTHPDGTGIITCGTNADCAAVGPTTGDCTVSATQNCFGNSGDSINVAGTFGSQEGGVLGSTFCIPPTASGAINGAAGSPGPAALRIAWQYDGLCDDGVTPYTLGGTTCPLP
jgi:hypothetical protein